MYQVFINYINHVKDDYSTYRKEDLISELKRLVEENNRLKEKYDFLEFEFSQLKKLVFGTRSERFISSSPPDQLSLA